MHVHENEKFRNETEVSIFLQKNCYHINIYFKHVLGPLFTNTAKFIIHHTWLRQEKRNKGVYSIV